MDGEIYALVLIQQLKPTKIFSAVCNISCPFLGNKDSGNSPSDSGKLWDADPNAAEAEVCIACSWSLFSRLQINLSLFCYVIVTKLITF